MSIIFHGHLYPPFQINDPNIKQVIVGGLKGFILRLKTAYKVFQVTKVAEIHHFGKKTEAFIFIPASITELELESES